MLPTMIKLLGFRIWGWVFRERLTDPSSLVIGDEQSGFFVIVCFVFSLKF